MAKREFLMLAHPINPRKHAVAGKFLSEKLDGMRCFWDGGVTRGLPTSQVPFANTAKDARYVEEVYATGLWTRYGKAIQAPDWWLNKLPKVPLDGELYMLGKRQELMSIVKKLSPDSDDWQEVQFFVFDSPPVDTILKAGVINAGPLFKKQIGPCNDWWKERAEEAKTRPSHAEFIDTYRWLQQFGNEVVVIHDQVRLPMQTSAAQDIINERLAEVLERGGEGMMLRNPYSRWIPERTYDLLKIKPRLDSEATVIGYTWGKEGKEGRLLGLMGSLELEWTNPLGQKVEFSISGFTYEERTMSVVDTEHPGEKVVDAYNPLFPIGSRVTFKYRTLTQDGKPEEAQFWRPADEN